jgi:uncharacterized membrane protein
MAESVRRPVVRSIAIANRPVSSTLLPIPIICFIGAVLTDLSYRGSGGNLLWVNFSSWLIASGLLFGALAGLAVLIDAIRGAAPWLSFGLFVAAWIVEFINSLVHARDGWTSVVPLGLTLSIIGALLILLAGWMAGERR